MDKGILNEVIEAEKDVQQCMEREQTRLQGWIVQVKHDAAEEVAREERAEIDAMDQARAEAKQAAELRARQLVSDAEDRAARSGRLDERILTDIIAKRIHRLLPMDHAERTP